MSLQYKGTNDWHNTKGMWDTGNTFASLVLRDLILNLGYRSDDIDLSKGSEFKVVGGGAVKTFGVVKLYCSLNSGPKFVEYFQVLDVVIEGYDVIISPPESRMFSSKKSTSLVAASIEPQRNLTEGELGTKSSIELTNICQSAEELKEMKKNPSYLMLISHWLNNCSSSIVLYLDYMNACITEELHRIPGEKTRSIISSCKSHPAS